MTFIEEAETLRPFMISGYVQGHASQKFLIEIEAPTITEAVDRGITAVAEAYEVVEEDLVVERTQVFVK